MSMEYIWNNIGNFFSFFRKVIIPYIFSSTLSVNWDAEMKVAGFILEDNYNTLNMTIWFKIA